MPEEQDSLIAEVVRELRAQPASDLNARVRVMAAVLQAQPPVRRGSFWDWLLTPRGIRISPLGGLAAVSLVAAAAVAIASLDSDRSADRGQVISTTAAIPPFQTPVPVQFVLVASAASRVAIVGDFNDWNASVTPLRQESRAGLWSVVVPLEPGRHQYAFVVDGKRWLADPSAPRAGDDDFGTPSSVITVGEKQT
ncbi:MAG: isoamylase early set domain-containing protein [Anaerolineae bacterium]|nr:isoamylase early set domain-containing protein [Gemmatimonadaceae bacterium]